MFLVLYNTMLQLCLVAAAVFGRCSSTTPQKTHVISVIKESVLDEDPGFTLRLPSKLGLVGKRDPKDEDDAFPYLYPADRKGYAGFYVYPGTTFYVMNSVHIEQKAVKKGDPKGVLAEAWDVFVAQITNKPKKVDPKKNQFVRFIEKKEIKQKDPLNTKKYGPYRGFRWVLKFESGMWNRKTDRWTKDQDLFYKWGAWNGRSTTVDELGAFMSEHWVSKEICEKVGLNPAAQYYWFSDSVTYGDVNYWLPVRFFWTSPVLLDYFAKIQYHMVEFQIRSAVPEGKTN